MRNIAVEFGRHFEGNDDQGKVPFYQRADRLCSEASGVWCARCRGVPEARSEPTNLLPVEEEVRWKVSPSSIEFDDEGDRPTPTFSPRDRQGNDSEMFHAAPYLRTARRALRHFALDLLTRWTSRSHETNPLRRVGVFDAQTPLRVRPRASCWRAMQPPRWRMNDESSKGLDASIIVSNEHGLSECALASVATRTAST